MFDTTSKMKRHSEARDFVRLLIAKAAVKEAGGGLVNTYVRKRWPESRNLDIIEKAAIAPGNIEGETWGDEISASRYLAQAFVEITLATSVFGRIEGARPMPFNVRYTVQTGTSSFAWVPTGGIVPVSAMSMTTGTFRPLKVGGIVVTTQELARFSDPGAESVISNDLGRGIGAFLNESFLDPTNAGVDGESPASITYGAPSVTSTGTSAAAANDDLRNMLQLITANMDRPYIVMRPGTALHLAATGDQTFRDLGPTGGTIWKIPVLTSSGVPQGGDSPPHNRITAFDAAQLMIGDAGLEVDVTDQADLLMDSEPDSPPTGSNVMVNLWQHNLVAFKATRFVNWQWCKSGAVAFIDNVEY